MVFRTSAASRSSFSLAWLLVLASLTINLQHVSVAAEVEHKTLPVGEKAPMFSSHTIEGQPWDLGEELSDGSVILFFWSFFCGPCRQEMPLIQEIHQELKDQPVTIVAVNLDEPPIHNPVKNFLKSSGYTYPIVVNKFGEEDAGTDKLYLVTGTPVIYMLKTDGTITFAHVGPMEPDALRQAITDNLGIPFS